MWRRPLNSTALATTTYRKPNGVFDGTSTQVRVRMINRCRVKMVRMRIYKVEGLLMGGGGAGARAKNESHLGHTEEKNLLGQA